MGPEEEVRFDGFLHGVGIDALVTGLFVGAEVGVRPAVEGAFFHFGEEVGREFVTQAAAGKVEDAKGALSAAISAYAKAAKGGVIKKKTAQRKASRLQLALNRAAAAPKATKTAKA
jgi:hypothetical protein